MRSAPSPRAVEERVHPARASSRAARAGSATAVAPRLGNAVLARLLGGHTCACGGTCADCRARAAHARMPVPPVVRDAVRAPGERLPDEVRAEMESRFASDFADVRVHRDATSARAARALGARAFAFGRDVVFGAGEYRPDSHAGRAVLAHELAHVRQQAGSRTRLDTLRSVPVAGATSSMEREAAHAAQAVADGRRVGPLTLVAAGGFPMLALLPGQPAGGCGLCYGTPADAGTEAHALIEEAFHRDRPEVDTEVALLLIPSPDDENGRLDLAQVDPDGNTIAIGEIKPANAAGLLQGDLDLFWYEDQLRLQGFRVTRLRVPPPIDPILFPTLAPPGCPQTQELFVDAPQQGVYTYWCTPDRRELLRECDCRGKRRRRGKAQPSAQDQPRAQPDRTRRRRRAAEPTHAEPVAPTVPVPVVVPTVTMLESALHELQPAIEQQLQSNIGPVPVGSRFFIVTTPTVYRVLIGEGHARRGWDYVRAPGFDPRSNPRMGYRNLGWRLIGIAGAAQAAVLTGGLVFAGTALGGAAATTASATAGTTAGVTTVTAPAIAAPSAYFFPAASAAVPVYGVATGATLSTTAATAAAATVAAVSGVVVVLALPAGEASAATDDGSGDGEQVEMNEVRVIPAIMQLIRGGTLHLGAAVTYDGRPYVIVGLAKAE